MMLQVRLCSLQKNGEKNSLEDKEGSSRVSSLGNFRDQGVRCGSCSGGSCQRRCRIGNCRRMIWRCGWWHPCRSDGWMWGDGETWGVLTTPIVTRTFPRLARECIVYSRMPAHVTEDAKTASATFEWACKCYGKNGEKCIQPCKIITDVSRLYDCSSVSNEVD